jgi:scyllo-inositol 2-dehydrogenase (NADP+)
MRVVVVGLGIQGRKRRAVAWPDAVASVDPVNPEADYQFLPDVPLSVYDAALVCTPDDTKLELLSYLLENGKHVLVEKPLLAPDTAALERLAVLARSRNAICYTAYNHRFEPHFIRMKQTLESGLLGRLYLCRMFYGNGTARDVRNSPWRDRGAGVLPDLGSHLLDTAIFWFRAFEAPFTVWSADRFENRACDHMLFGARGAPALEMEITFLSWRNHFTADVYGERGSAHIESLCKWGPSSFIRRTRVLPSGRPPEETITLVQPDPTWAAEYEHFKRLCARGAEAAGDLATDIRLNEILNDLASQAARREER